ncbi:hypothetical protein TWF481_005608 [Arthrobotrys musiformis]|uniref:F-box domain-containing protein n=1 Tax=Arthrobotrys musiformis TaxID=47236 RepID=A0AAV9WGE1_9PEZI
MKFKNFFSSGFKSIYTIKNRTGLEAGKVDSSHEEPSGGQGVDDMLISNDQMDYDDSHHNDQMDYEDSHHNDRQEIQEPGDIAVEEDLMILDDSQDESEGDLEQPLQMEGIEEGYPGVLAPQPAGVTDSVRDSSSEFLYLPPSRSVSPLYGRYYSDSLCSPAVGFRDDIERSPSLPPRASSSPPSIPSTHEQSGYNDEYGLDDSFEDDLFPTLGASSSSSNSPPVSTHDQRSYNYGYDSEIPEPRPYRELDVNDPEDLENFLSGYPGRITGWYGGESPCESHREFADKDELELLADEFDMDEEPPELETPREIIWKKGMERKQRVLCECCYHGGPEPPRDFDIDNPEHLRFLLATYPEELTGFRRWRGVPWPSEEKDLVLKVLPLEIMLEVFGYLNSDEKGYFARCSRWCYCLAFSARYRGVILKKAGELVPRMGGRGGIKWKEGGSDTDTVVGVDVSQKPVISDFERGGWLELARYHVRSAIIPFSQKELQNSLPSIDTFPKLTHLTITLTMGKGLERNLCVAVIKELSKLAVYDNLQHLTFQWNEPQVPDGISHQVVFDSDSDDDELGATYRWGAKEVQLQRAYRKSFAKLSDGGKKFLGPFIKAKEFSKVVGGLKIPRNLKSLDLFIQSEDSSFVVPLLKHFGDKLDFGISLKGCSIPLRDIDNYEAGAVELKSVKRLILAFPDGYESLKFKYLNKQFPNLAKLRLTECQSYDGTELWDILPDLPELSRLEYQWPRSSQTIYTTFVDMFVEKSLVEKAIADRLDKGHFESLRSVLIAEARLSYSKGRRGREMCISGGTENLLTDFREIIPFVAYNRSEPLWVWYDRDGRPYIRRHELDWTDLLID